jgi:ribosomal protein RSM22 (predicted rRNA methylase)
MELPPLLRRAVDNALNGTALSDLAATAAALSDRYREERHDIKPRVISDREALAYLAVRLPATYAAIRSSFNAVAEDRPDFMPGNALDVGAGPPGPRFGPPPNAGPPSPRPCLSRPVRFFGPTQNG